MYTKSASSFLSFTLTVISIAPAIVYTRRIPYRTFTPYVHRFFLGIACIVLLLSVVRTYVLSLMARLRSAKYLREIGVATRLILQRKLRGPSFPKPSDLVGVSLTISPTAPRDSEPWQPSTLLL